MEQLWYTSSATTRGHGVRAASAALATRSERQDRLIRHIRYALPDAVSFVDLRPEDAPLAFMYVDAGGERALLCKRHVRYDYRGRVGNNFFTHLLTALPADWTVRDCIQRWQSPFWRRSDDSLSPQSTDLPDVAPEDVPPGPLGLDDLRRLDLREPLKEALRLFLAQGATGRLFVMAPAEKVAALVWGLAHCLPAGFLPQLTFSTYEANPLAAVTRVVGTFPMVGGGRATQSPDLPANCYAAPHAGLNLLASPTPLPEGSRVYAELAAFGVNSLFDHRADWDALLSTADRLGVTEPARLLSLFRFFYDPKAPGHLTCADLSRILEEEGLACELFARPAWSRHLTQTALKDQRWWSSEGQPALQRVVGRRSSDGVGGAAPESLEAFLRVLLREISRYLEEDPPNDNGKWLLEQVLFRAAPKTWPHSFLELLADLGQRGLAGRTEPAHAALRRWVLQQSCKAQECLPDTHRAQMFSLLDPWLNLSWAELGEQLRGGPGLPDCWLQEAVARRIRQGLPSDTRAERVLTDHAAELGHRLGIMAISPDPAQSTASQRFLAALAEAHLAGRAPLLLGALRPALDQPRTVAGLIRAAALEPSQTARLVEEFGQRLLTGDDADPVAEALVARHVGTGDLQALRSAGVLDCPRLLGVALEDERTRAALIEQVAGSAREWSQYLEANWRMATEDPTHNRLRGACQNLARDALRRVVEETAEGDANRGTLLLRHLVEVVLGRQEACLELLRCLGPRAGALQWQRREPLLRHLADQWSMADQGGKTALERAMRPLLEVAPPDLETVIKAAFPAELRARALYLALDQPNADPAPIMAIAGTAPQCFFQAFRAMAHDPEASAACRELCVQAMRRNLPNRMEWLDAFIAARPRDYHQVDKAIRDSKVGPEEAGRLLRKWPEELLSELAHRPVVIQLIEAFVSQLTWRSCQQQNTLCLLERLRMEPACPPDARQLVRGYHIAANFLLHGGPWSAPLARELGGTLARVDSVEHRQRLADALVPELFEKFSRVEDLVAALRSLGPPLAGSVANLYAVLLLRGGLRPRTVACLVVARVLLAQDEAEASQASRCRSLLSQFIRLASRSVLDSVAEEISSMRGQAGATEAQRDWETTVKELGREKPGVLAIFRK